MEKESEKIPQQSVPEQKPDVAGKKVLVIDDDPGSQELIKGVLGKVGFVIQAASNGQEGLVLTQQFKPDVIILDVLMPEMDGFSYFKELKKSQDTEGLPVIIITIRKNMEESFLSLGADGFIPKPIDTGRLLDEVTRLAMRSAQKPPETPPPEAKTE